MAGPPSTKAFGQSSPPAHIKADSHTV
ncbi:unnamed protein product [Plutella xylostella]|uniref:(diamondback moth) hypothetical protein n=1 Tax=Plutella xylostella TaxID=51655 RepID=A0A8S4G5H1_PLUXY|nr:unnamed protein product [Plutella xylostella]